jgi:hypothetical protein
MDSERPKDMLMPKMMGMRKPSRKACSFLVPSRMTKEGRSIMTKRCTAYIPNFEVTEEREICEFCLVPDMFVRDDRCIYFAPQELSLEVPTTWRCGKSRKKNIDPGQCSEKYCADYQKGEKNRWDIGRLGRSDETSADKASGLQAEGAKAPEKAGEAPRKEEQLAQRPRLIPKSLPSKKKVQKDTEES